MAQWLYWSRSIRPGQDNGDVYGEPVWDITLDLYIQMKMGRRVPVTSSCIAARVPATTALRYIAALEKEGRIVREEDEKDRRRSFIALSPSALKEMDDYIDEVLGRLWQILPESIGSLNVRQLDNVCQSLQEVASLLRQRSIDEAA